MNRNIATIFSHHSKERIIRRVKCFEEKEHFLTVGKDAILLLSSAFPAAVV
jgi:hypothetical protein